MTETLPKNYPIKPRQIMFVKKMVKDKKPAVKAYQEVYGQSTYETAKTNASALLTKNNIKLEVKRQLEEIGITDNYTDQNLKTLIDAGISNAHKTKPETALEAIKFVNVLKDRLPATKSVQATLSLDKLYNNDSLGSLKAQLEAQQKETEKLMALIDKADQA